MSFQLVDTKEGKVGDDWQRRVLGQTARQTVRQTVPCRILHYLPIYTRMSRVRIVGEGAHFLVTGFGSYTIHSHTTSHVYRISGLTSKSQHTHDAKLINPLACTLQLHTFILWSPATFTSGRSGAGNIYVNDDLRQGEHLCLMGSYSLLNKKLWATWDFFAQKMLHKVIFVGGLVP